MEKVYDVLIIGGGVAGMSAAIYAKRAGKNVAIIEKFALGGQVLQLEKIENFPSQTSIDGISLSQMFSKQIKNLEIEIIYDEIISVSFGKMHKLQGKKDEYFAQKVVVATGMAYQSLGIGEEVLMGRGVSFCAVCDGNFYKNKKVLVASKKGSGIKDALYLSKMADEVVLLDSEDMSVYAKANKIQNLKVVSNCKILSVNGSMKFGSIKADVDGKTQDFEASALFVSLGRKAGTSILQENINLDEKGFVVVDDNMRTSVDGVYAIGDVRNGHLKQIVTACSDGAIAGNDC